MTARILYGTDEPAPPARQLTAGALSVTLAPGGVAAVHWHGVEVLRAAQALVRDTDWGTWPEEQSDDLIAQQPDGFRLTRRFTIAGGAVMGQIAINATVNTGGAKLTLDLTLDPVTALSTNRAGFVVLHPATLAGSALEVRSADGQAATGRFPLTISPGQPYRGIGGLGWSIGPVHAELSFHGEVFEMEDQRNWSDGSYKTYCRPLALPWPYDLVPGAPVQQGLRLAITGARPASAAGAAVPTLEIGAVIGTMPAMHLAQEPGWAAPDHPLPPVQGRRLRIDLTAGVPSHIPPAAPGDDELELILPDDAASARHALDALAAVGLRPTHIAAVPAAYMTSHQPDGIWPTGLRPEDALDLAAQAFPMARPMGGMLTFFTELNRYPTAAGTGDSVTFGTAAVVHDAGDLPVMQTLGAQPAIFHSAGLLAGDRPLRLGLVAIGMRCNPYGAALAANPDNRRRTMTAHDPRHRAAFGAAFALGAFAATAGSAVQSLCLGATGGPFGIDGADGLSPLGHLIAALARDAGRPRHAVTALPGVAAVASDRHLFLASLGPEPVASGLPPAPSLGPFEVRIIDRTGG
jgi:hypothetical protein